MNANNSGEMNNDIYYMIMEIHIAALDLERVIEQLKLVLSYNMQTMKNNILDTN